jgi:hypothetical protein
VVAALLATGKINIWEACSASVIEKANRYRGSDQKVAVLSNGTINNKVSFMQPK